MKRIFKLFSKENSVRSASILLIVTLTISNILGFLRDRFLTKNIALFDLDVYYASFRIPDLIFNFLILGTVTSAFIPVFSDYLARKEEKEAWKITNSLINIALLFTIVAAIIFYFLMPAAIHLVVPKFDADRLSMAIRFSRLLMITPIFFAVSYILGGVLNSYNRFFAYSLAPLFYNASIIVGAFFSPKYGMDGVVICVIIGSFLHLLIQLPAVFKVGFNYQFILDYKNTAIRKIIKLMLPRTISMGVGQIMLLVFTAIASSLAIGSISAFTLGNNIQTFPIVVLGTSFATAIFPTLSQKISQADYSGFSFYLDRALRSIAFLLIPSSVIFILLRAQIVRLLYGSGKFNWSDTKMTAIVLGFFSISLVAQGVIPLLAKAFYALKNTKTPMYISIVTVAISVLLAFIFSHYYSVAGLALAFSLGSIVNAVLLFYYLQRGYSNFWESTLLLSVLRIIAVSFLMGVAVWLTMHFMANIIDMTRFWGVLTQTVVSAAIGFLVYVLLSYVFRCEELRWAITRQLRDKAK